MHEIPSFILPSLLRILPVYPPNNIMQLLSGSHTHAVCTPSARFLLPTNNTFAVRILPLPLQLQRLHPSVHFCLPTTVRRLTVFTALLTSSDCTKYLTWPAQELATVRQMQSMHFFALHCVLMHNVYALCTRHTIRCGRCCGGVLGLAAAGCAG